MRNMNCPDIRREIEEAGSANLLTAAALSHLEACPACETLSRRQRKLQAIVSSLGTVEAPGDFDFRLRARLANEKRGSARPFGVTDFSFGFRSAAVAVILLLIGSAFVFVNFRTRQGNGVAGGKQIAPALTPDSQPRQVQPPSGHDANEVAEGRTRNRSEPIAANVLPSGRTSKVPGARRELATLRGGDRFATRDLSSTPARVLTRDDKLKESYPTAAFPINASYQSLKVSVDDGRGTSRTISLPSVSFGSQRALSQNASPLIAKARGSW